jgi:hypothetical protein
MRYGSWTFCLLTMLCFVLVSTPLKSEAPSHRYVTSEDGVYFYEPAPSPLERERGVSTAFLSGFRYYGINDAGEYMVVSTDDNGREAWTAFCTRVCKVIRFNDGRRLANRANLLLNSVFSDAISGRLTNSNPVALQVFVPSHSPVELTSAEQIKTLSGLTVSVSSHGNQAVYAPNGGIVSESGFHPAYKQYVKLRHGAGIETIVGNLDKRLVIKDYIVTSSTVLGRSACTSSCFIIYEVRVEGRPVNPLPYMVPDEGRFKALFQSWKSLEKVP